MAADMRREDLPPPWRYAVTRDSRIYFINDETQSTSWLHPVTGQPVQTGYRGRKDLPSGWEEAVTPEGAPYFVDHRGRKTTFQHPVTGQTPSSPRDYILMDRSTIADSRSTSTVSFQDDRKSNSTNKSPMDLGIIGGTLKEPKKEPPSPGGYLMRGWLSKQDHGGIKSWRKRWFVLTNRGLLYYKNEGETSLLGSIVLIGYKVEAIAASSDKSKSQKHAFKLTHPSHRAYIFSAETREDMVKWLKALNAVTTNDTPANSTNNVPSTNKQNNQGRKADETDDAGFNQRDYALRPRVVSSSSQEGNTPTPSQQSAQNGYQPNYRSPQLQENRQNSPNYVQYRPRGDHNGHSGQRPVSYHAGMAIPNNRHIQERGSKPSSVDTDSGYHGSERRPVQNSRSDSRLLPYANDPRGPYRTNIPQRTQQPPDPRVVQRSESLQRLQQWKSQTLERQGRSRSDLSTVDEVPRANYRNYQQDNGSSNYSAEHQKGVYPDSYKTLPRHIHMAQLSPKYNVTPPNEESWHISTLPRNTNRGYQTVQDQYYARYKAWEHTTPADPQQLKREESLRQLSDWRQRTLSSSTSQGSGPTTGPDHTRSYQDERRREPPEAVRQPRPVSEHFSFPATRSVDAVRREARPVSSFHPASGMESPPPVRPPLPAAYRQQDYGVDRLDAAPSRSYRTAVQEPSQPSHANYNHLPDTKKETKDDAYSLSDIDDVFASEAAPTSRPNFKLTSSDLMGKSHEELTLLLIQLKRDQDQLVEEHNDALAKMMAYTRAGASGLHSGSPQDDDERWKQYEELRRKCEESERKLNASRPMLSLVSNMVKLGDLYNTPDNRHNKQYDQFGRRTNPELTNRDQFEFSRQLEEQQVGTVNAGLQHSPSDDKLVNIKSMRIREIDGHMQELTARVTVLKEDMENLERTLHSTSKKMAQYRDQPHEKDRYASLQAAIQSEISKVRGDLAQESKKLEAFSSEHGQLSNELRAVHSRLWEDSTSTTASSPSKASEKAAMKNRLQQDLAHVQSMMAGLAQQRDRLEGHVNSIRQEFSGGGDGPFVETDLDTGIQHDLRARQQTEPENHTDGHTQHQTTVPTILIHQPEGTIAPAQTSGEKVFKSSLSVRALKRESAERRSRDRHHVPDREVIGGEADDMSRIPPKRSNTLPGRPRVFGGESINNMTARSLKRVSRSSSDVSRLRIPSSGSSEGGRRKPSASERLFGGGGGISRSAVDLRTLSQQEKPGRYKKSSKSTSALKKPRQTKPRPDFSAPVEPFHGTTDLEIAKSENSPTVIETDIEPVEFDLDWNKELLPPSKTVLIPERYVSDTESEDSLTPEEQAQRRKKAEKFHKLLSNYSMQDMVKNNTEREKKNRAHILSVQAALASQVKKESRKMARSPHLERKQFTMPEDKGTYL